METLSVKTTIKNRERTTYYVQYKRIKQINIKYDYCTNIYIELIKTILIEQCTK